MTTARQIRTLVRPLLERHGDLALVANRMLWLTPVTHVAREIWIGRTGSASYFKPEWFLTPLFLPDMTPASSGGWCSYWMGRSPDAPVKGPGDWYWDDPTMPEDFVRQVEKALPVLRPLDTLQACRPFAEAHIGSSWGRDWSEQLVYDIAFGHLRLARCWWERVTPSFEEGGYLDTPEHRRVRDRYRALREPLMDDDRTALAALLHRWERENVTGTAAEPLWTPSPFPIEQAA